MENKVMMAGFGGQGIMLMGQLLGHASNDCDKYATYYPSYGPEMRGGTANCTVVISDEMISSPVPESIDVLIAMNQPSLDKYLYRVKEGGMVIANSSHIKTTVEREDVEAYYIQADDIARDIGSVKCSNMVMLGAYIKLTNALDINNLIKTMKIQMASKESFLKINEEAILQGEKQILGKATSI